MTTSSAPTRSAVPARPGTAASGGTDPSLADAIDLAASLDVDPSAGLASGEALRRLARDGPNVLRSAPPTPLWRRFVAQMGDPLVVLLLVAAGIALAAWAVEGHGGVPVDAIVIGVVVVLNAVLGLVHEARAQSVVAALSRMTAASSSVRRDQRVVRIPSEELVRGDLLVLSEGDAVGADARLLQCAALRVQEASLTGESEAVLKDPARLSTASALGDRLNMVFKGTTVLQGTGLAVVCATGMDTQVGAIAGMLEATRPGPTPLQKEIARVGRMLGIAVMIIAVVVIGTVLVMHDVQTTAGFIGVLLLGVSLAVAAVPEGLPAILSVVLALGVQRMARRKAIVRTLSSVETLGSASVIASDKTGTLTRAEMTVERIATASGVTRATGVGYAPTGRIEHGGTPLAGGPVYHEQVVVLSGGSLAGNASLRETADGDWEIEGDPTEAAFLVAERKLGVTDRRLRRFSRVAELPFTSQRKMMSTVERDHEHGDMTVLITKGAPDVLIERCTHARVGLETVPLDARLRAQMLEQVREMSDASLRTLSVAYRPLSAQEAAQPDERLESGLIFVGTVGMLDPPRAEATAAIRDARRAGIRVVMITGDHPRTAARIAADLGIADASAGVLTGLQIEAMDDAAFAHAVRGTAVYARVAPEHKLRIVGALQAAGEIVAMTGDGVNDAPALKAADIGVAMGIAGTEVAKQAAKMILVDDNFATIVDAVREGRRILDNIRKFLRYLLSSNMGEVMTVFFGVIGAAALGLTGADGAAALPLLATQILWINLVTDSGPALAMGVDPETDDVMARAPRRPDDRVIDAAMWWSVVETGLVMSAATLLTIDLYLPGGLIDGSGDLDTARTAGFTVLVLAQLFNCLNARSDVRSAFRHLFANRWLWMAIGLSVLLQLAVVHVGLLNTAFGTRPLDAAQWAVCVAMGSSVLWVAELRKLALRARSPG